MTSFESTLTKRLNDYLQQRSLEGMLRKHRVHPSEQATLNFSCNDYLSLTQHPRLKQAYQQGFSELAVGSGGSPVVCGYTAEHHALARAFAEALKVDDCLIFSSGYAANVSLLHFLAHFQVNVLLDRAAHASLYDGVRLSGTTFERFRHNDLDHLRVLLGEMATTAVIMTESVFSMSGQIAPLRAMVSLAEAHRQTTIVDEAHAFGLLGPEGLGAIEAEGLTQNDIPLRVIPLGKAMSAHGAIVAGQRSWIEALLQCARSYIYSTAMSPAMAYGLRQTLDVVRGADDRRRYLFDLVQYFQQKIQQSPLTWRDSSTPIQQIQLGCPHRALTAAEHLSKHGIICMPMRQPTVSREETGLRVILNYHHKPEDIDALFKCLHAL